MRIIMMTLQMYKQKTTYARERMNFLIILVFDLFTIDEFQHLRHIALMSV